MGAPELELRELLHAFHWLLRGLQRFLHDSDERCVWAPELETRREQAPGLNEQLEGLLGVRMPEEVQRGSRGRRPLRPSQEYRSRRPEARCRPRP